MVSSDVENMIYGLKLSSVGPGAVTGAVVVHEPTDMDLAMKLHYLRGVYFFNNTAVQVSEIRKCNDCGVRIIEAQCSKTLDEWLEMKDYTLDSL
ncbi:hypothetical protein HHK36_020224 [Tetracentron sinense]|uniref:Uncharacterized protein n=1 Tax=Tetracentron sinense TaxID=13715 RepID=A0A835DAR4_TETSI|nr:hypothetical protein HHK36_020224 [Tetracentron sinense]